MAPYCTSFFFGSSTGRCRCVPRTVAIPAGRRLDGFATWFECDFGDGSPKLSTAPAAQATHWKQTIFYLREPVEGEGHEVEGQGSVWWLGGKYILWKLQGCVGGPVLLPRIDEWGRFCWLIDWEPFWVQDNFLFLLCGFWKSTIRILSLMNVLSRYYPYTSQKVDVIILLGGGFIFLILTLTLREDPIWLFFKEVETTT